jgi:MFS family permease
MAATARLVPPERRGMSSGIVNAGGSFGQFVFVPIAQGATALGGWVAGVWTMSVVVLLALPAAWMLRGKPSPGQRRRHRQGPSRRPSRRRSRTEATCCSAPASSSAAFTSPSSPPTCPGSSPRAASSPNVGAWALRIVGSSTSPAA